MSPFRFNLNRTIQAAAVLLRLSRTKESNYMRLIKLMYIADRESLRTAGRPITGDRVVAMCRGPVLSRVLDLIKDCDAQSREWNAYIERDDYHVRLVEDPGNDDLTPHEISTLQQVWDDHRGLDEWDLVNKTHEFSEWKKNDPGDSSRPIPLTDILEAVGRLGDLDKIKDAARQSAGLQQLFGG